MMQKTYELACSFLRSMLPDQLSESDLNKYFIGDSRDFTSIQDIYERFIYSAQNYQGMPNVIKYHQRREVIKRILCNFDVVNIQNMEVEKLYQKFRKEFNVTSKDTKRNSWRKWSFSIIDTAKFISNFKSVDDFRGFVERFNYNRLTRMALPLLISTKIRGIGFALACDTLKELGYLSYPKPDVHLIEVFSQIGLSNEHPISVFETIVEMAYVCKDIDPESSPYKLDKIIWLICSGKFYLDGINIDGRKMEFIKYLKEELNL